MNDSIDDMQGVGTLLRQLRREKEMTQQQLATRAGVSFSFVNQVERGKATVRLDALNKLLRVFDYAMGPVRVREVAAGAEVAERKDLCGGEAGSPSDTPARSRPKNDWAVY
jgi:transcriptional regulator with XRE-family HTH domain